ncbi:MAG: transposase, partial [Rubrobacteraceae bacterium]
MLLACVGVDEEGFQEVLAVEVAGSEKGAAYASLLRGLEGVVRLVVSDDHEGLKAAVAGELCRGRGGRGASSNSSATCSPTCRRLRRARRARLPRTR